LVASALLALFPFAVTPNVNSACVGTLVTIPVP